MSAKDEDADVGDDALQQLLNETERLMHDLDTKDETKPALVIEGFSIDSDEEGDESGTNTKVDAGDHPLSEEWLSTPAPASAPHTSPISAPLPSTMPSLFANGGTAESSVASPAAGATMDSLKQQTTRFASNLASMAQRAASQVAAAAAPVQVTGAPTVTQAQSFPGQAFTGLSQEPSQIIQEPKATPTNGSDLSKEQKAQLIKDYAGEMLPGEHIIMFVSNLLHVSDTSGVSYAASQSSDAFMWCCAMSYYRLILFSTLPDAHTNHPPPPGWSPVCWPPAPVTSKLLEIPLASIDRVEKTVYQASGSSYMGLVVYAKDCCRTIRFTTPSYADTGRAYDSLNTYAFPGRRNLGYLFAFESKREEVMASVKVDEKSGQQSITIAPTSKRFDPMIEYPRLLSKASITQSPWIIWASINSTYQMSPTYPSVLVGPATLDETKPESQHVIRQCAAFRSEQRLPSMTWCNIGGASIWRSSQPKVGLQGNRSPADELFLRHVAESARGANAMAEPPPIYPKSVLQQLTGSYSKDWVPEPGCGLKILDLRPRSAAMANRTGGYGYENTSNYPNTTLQFCNIPNIHAVRDGYQKLCSVCNGKSTSDVSWNSLIEDTKWLSYVRMILAASWETAYWVHVWRMPVLLHCSHGWDRTSQVAALAQLFLDPFLPNLPRIFCSCRERLHELWASLSHSLCTW